MFATLFWAPTGSCPLFFVSVFSTHISYTLFKTFWALFWGPRGYCPLFSNSPSPAAYPYNFSAVSTFFLTSFFTVLNLLMIIEPPDDRRSKFRSARFHQHCAIKYTNLHGSTYSPRKYFQHTSPILFFKKIFSKLFGALFRGPSGSCPLFSNSPSPATYPIFFPTFRPHFSLPSSR